MNTTALASREGGSTSSLVIGSLLLRMFNASFSFYQGPREPMLRVMLIGLTPSWTMQPLIFCASW